MNLLQIARIARHDARTIMGTGTYVLLFLSPLLTTLLFAVLVFAATLMLSLVEVAAPDEAPLGHHRVAIVSQKETSDSLHGLFEIFCSHVERESNVASGQARILKRFLAFVLNAAYDRRTPDRPDETAHPASPGTSDEEAGQERGSGPVEAPNPAAKQGRPGHIDVVALPDGDWDTTRALVPKVYDAAILLSEDDRGQIRYEIAYDSGLMFSRVMKETLEERIEDFNQTQRESRLSARRLTFIVLDRLEGPVDLWLARAVLFLTVLGIAFLYHSVGMQSVASILAGEREARTLDVLLSTPVTWRQILYGKLLGLVIATATPTLCWSLTVCLAAYVLLGIAIPFGPVCLLLVSLLAFLTAIGCAISASSPSTLQAKNRLGMVNMATFVVGGGLLALPSAWWPGGNPPLSLLVSLVTDQGKGLLLILLSAALLAGTAIITEVGRLLSRQT